MPEMKTLIVVLDAMGKLVGAMDPSDPKRTAGAISYDVAPRSGQTVHEIELPTEATAGDPSIFRQTLLAALAVPGATKPYAGRRQQLAKS